MDTTFPIAIKVKDRVFFDRFEIEKYKLSLAGLPPPERDPGGPVILVPAKIVAAELGVCRRTLARRIVESEGR